MSKLNAKIMELHELHVPDQEIGNTRLNVMPFEHTAGWVSLPEPYKMWEEALNAILQHVPVQEGATQHYITINSEFFTESGTQRREGVHIDGNFCVDPTFVDRSGQHIACWAGLKIPSWAGMSIKEGVYKERADNSHVEMDWVLPYNNVVIPIAKYVSDTKGGLFVVSSNVGTRAWQGEFEDQIAAEGSCENMLDQLTPERSQYVPKNRLVFMTSNTPHETLPIEAGTRRTFMRLTLNHAYDNTAILGQTA